MLFYLIFDNNPSLILTNVIKILKFRSILLNYIKWNCFKNINNLRSIWVKNVQNQFINNHIIVNYF